MAGTTSGKATTKRSGTAKPKPAAAKRSSGTKSRTTKAATKPKRSPQAKKRSTKPKPASRTTASNGNAAVSRNGNGGAVDTVKHAASKAAGPAIAVGAAAVGVVGGIVLKSRTRKKTVLGVARPRGIGKEVSNLDAKAIAKSVGSASKQFAKTSKKVSKDLERAGDSAERIGKILD